MKALATWVLALMALTVTGAEARNYPCSGKKGGVSPPPPNGTRSVPDFSRKL
jgi:hypothetical protein